ncbi:CDP-glycerol glycerophosphotransferase family protein [Nitrospinota bacterium]
MTQNESRIEGFYIGEGSIRTIFFCTLDAGVMVMTMPDIESFHIKRSVHPVHYVYIHHSIISTHMAYHQEAFDHFDTIFCVGPHHIEETREREKRYGLSPKELFDFGYCRLDSILETAKERKGAAGAGPKPLRVLIAPSWGPDGLLETRGEALVESLLDEGYYVTVRPHPQTRRFTPATLDSLFARFRNNIHFDYEENVASQESLHASHLMISDWSGAALEYAFGLERPVLFIDGPRKVNNPEYQKLDAVPLEVKIREEIGAILPAGRIHEAPKYVEHLTANSTSFSSSIRAARDRWVFHVGRSASRGAARIVELADRASASRGAASSSVAESFIK